MCTTCDEIGSAAHPSGRFRAIWDRFRGKDPTPADRPEPEPDRPAWLDDPEYMERLREVMHAEAVARNLRAGRRLCAQCQQLLGDEPEPLLHRDWCWTCDSQFIEERFIVPLVERLGRRGARRALARLVRTVESLV